MSDLTTKPVRRIGLSFSDEEAVIVEIQRLRKGNTRAGHWTLAQVCDHLERSIRSRMQPGPFPPNTPEQVARRAEFEQVLATGRIPDGITAPDSMQPAPGCGDEAIDACIECLRQFRAFAGPVAPHRLFGHLSEADARRLNLIHCAHHLSFLLANE